jgi:hypothetical protein
MFDPVERYANVMLALVSPVRRGREQLHRFADLLISVYHARLRHLPKRANGRRTWLSLTDHCFGRSGAQTWTLSTYRR